MKGILKAFYLLAVYNLADAVSVSSSSLISSSSSKTSIRDDPNWIGAWKAVENGQVTEPPLTTVKGATTKAAAVSITTTTSKTTTSTTVKPTTTSTTTTPQPTTTTTTTTTTKPTTTSTTTPIPTTTTKLPTTTTTTLATTTTKALPIASDDGFAPVGVPPIADCIFDKNDFVLNNPNDNTNCLGYCNGGKFLSAFIVSVVKMACCCS